MPLIEAGDTFACESEGQIMGAMTVTPAADHAEASSVAVDPATQRLGIGRPLMSFAEEFANARGLRIIRLCTSAALLQLAYCYGRLGFDVLERKLDEGDDGVSLERVLPGDG